MQRIKVGDTAPDFELENQNEEKFKLSDNRGKRVLLSFHPLAWTSVCAEQMKSLERNKEAFDSFNTVAVGLSVDSVPCKKAWAESLGIARTSLLSDFWQHGEVAARYGIFRNDDGISERANVVVDENGKVVCVKVYEIGTLPPIEEILDFLRE
jgi:peroxiredoxin